MLCSGINFNYFILFHVWVICTSAFVSVPFEVNDTHLNNWTAENVNGVANRPINVENVAEKPKSKCHLKQTNDYPNTQHKPYDRFVFRSKIDLPAWCMLFILNRTTEILFYIWCIRQYDMHSAAFLMFIVFTVDLLHVHIYALNNELLKYVNYAFDSVLIHVQYWTANQ